MGSEDRRQGSLWGLSVWGIFSYYSKLLHDYNICCIKHSLPEEEKKLLVVFHMNHDSLLYFSMRKLTVIQPRFPKLTQLFSMRLKTLIRYYIQLLNNLKHSDMKADQSDLDRSVGPIDHTVSNNKVICYYNLE